MTLVIGARDARNNFADLLGRVGYGGEIAIIQRSGKPMAALIPLELYKQLISEREAHFEVLNRIRSRLPDVSAEEVEQDVDRAIAAVRASDVTGGA